MQQILIAVYPWAKTLHIVSMVAWMAGLFYLPRVFVYHAERAAIPGETSEIFKVMESKLLRLIMTPAMIATWFFGLILLGVPGTVNWTSDLWIYPKLGGVLVLTWFHHWLGLRRRDFALDKNTVSGRSFRLMNEAPTLMLLLIVTMVVVKPF